MSGSSPCEHRRNAAMTTGVSGGFAATMAWLHRELAAPTTVVAHDRDHAREVATAVLGLLADLDTP